ncbi:unnamed protein product [Toxocara canis]|uniref:Smoothelin domain-containing protein n=1 Tax=Toxocara canis TaxID=6265 RepID=A0A183UEE6_TOXCA|nr:unnamed protein product [Toxocara canis]
MSSGTTTRPNLGALIGNQGKLIAPVPGYRRRQILRGRMIISMEQLMEEWNAEAGISSESSCYSELSVEESRRIAEERQEMIQQKIAMGGLPNLRKGGLMLPDFNMVTDHAPPINLTVSASMLDETSSVATTTMNIDIEGDDDTENINPISQSSGSVENLYESLSAPVAQQIQPDFRRSLAPQENKADKVLSRQSLAAGKTSGAAVGGEALDVAITKREGSMNNNAVTTATILPPNTAMATTNNNAVTTATILPPDTAMAATPYTVPAPVMAQEELPNGMAVSAAMELTLTEMEMGRAHCEISSDVVTDRLTEVAAHGIPPIMSADEEEPMEVDSSLSEAERSKRKSIVKAEMICAQDKITKPANVHSQGEAFAMAADKNQQIAGKNICSDVQQRDAFMADFVIGSTQGARVSRKWVNAVPRKSFAYGQSFGDDIDRIALVNGRYSLESIKTTGSGMRAIHEEVAGDIAEVESSESSQAPVGNDQDATLTTANLEERDRTYTVMTEEVAANILVDLSEATNKDLRTGSIPNPNAFVVADGRKDTSASSQLSAGGSDIGAASTCPQEITIINRAMENSALEPTPKSRWDDTMTAENGEKNKLAFRNSASRSTFDDESSTTPAPFKGTFDESSIAKGTSETTNSCTLIALDDTRSMRDELLNILDMTNGKHMMQPKTNRTLLSFKTPKKATAVFATKTHTQNAATNKNNSEQAKQDRRSGRVTSTPNAETHICPRFTAHQAAFATPVRGRDHRSEMSKSPSVPRMVRIRSGTRILHSPVMTVAKEDSSSPFRAPTVPANNRMSRPSMALFEIANYESPLSTPSRGIHSEHLHDTERSSLLETSSRSPFHLPVVSPRPSSRTSRIPAPIAETGKRTNDSNKMSADVAEYLRSGGTPRPSSQTESAFGHSMIFASSSILRSDVMKSGPRIRNIRFGGQLIANSIIFLVLVCFLLARIHTDVSAMLLEKAAMSGPVNRRQPRERRLSRFPLPNLSKLNFDEDSGSDEEQTTQEIQKNAASEQPTSTHDMDLAEPSEENPMKVVIIDSDEDGDYGIDGLESDTTRLTIDDAIDSGDEGALSSKADDKKQHSRKSIRAKLIDLSIATVDSPNIENVSTRRLQEATQQCASLASASDDGNTTTPIGSPLHLVAANKKRQQIAYLAKRKILHPSNVSQEGVRRSARNRVAPARRWLGEVPVYRVDSQGNRELVDVSLVRVRDPFFVKYGTASMEVALERQRQMHKRHAHSRQLLQNAKLARKQKRIKELKEKHRRCEDLDVSVTDIRTSSDSEGDEQ